MQSSKRSVHFDRPASSSASLSGNASSLLSRRGISFFGARPTDGQVGLFMGEFVQPHVTHARGSLGTQ